MADDKTKAAPQTAELISLTEEYKIAYWRKRFGVSDDRLAEAVHRVGLSAAAVEAHLNKWARAKRPRWPKGSRGCD